MTNTGLYGSYTLTKIKIDEIVTSICAGVYVLGHSLANGTFIVQYVGRSDTDVNSRLKQWVGGDYTQFKLGYFSSPKTAFEKECTVYHDFGGQEGLLDNSIHPQRPQNTNWECQGVMYLR